MEGRAETTGILSLMEAAGELRTTHLRVLMLLKEGVLQGNQDSGEWVVTRESVNSFRAQGGKVQTATKCRKSCGGGSCGSH